MRRFLLILAAFSALAGSAWAAATITVGSLTLASDGKTLTGTLAGGTGTGYTPASAVTGLTVHSSAADAIQYHQLSTAISGTTLTINLDTIITSGTTVKLDVSASSNLSDSGANTATAATNTAITNSSTKTATTYGRANNTNLSIAGCAMNTAGTAVGRSYAGTVTSSARFETVATGTDLSMPLFFGNAKVQVDGGAVVSVSNPNSGGWGYIPLFSGLTDAAHSVVVTYNTTAFFWDVTNTIYLTGSAPAAALPSTYGKSYAFASVGSYVRIDPPAVLGNGVADAGFQGNDSGWSFKTTGGASAHSYQVQPVIGNNDLVGNFMVGTDGTLRLYTLLSGNAYCLTIDGVEQATLATTANTSAYGWVTLFSGLDATAVDETASWVARSSAFWLGDSIVNVVYAGGTGDTRIGDPHRIGPAAAIAVGEYGVPGSGVPTSASLPSTATAPAVIFTCWGTNDASASAAQATFTSRYQSVLGDLRTKFPSAKLIIRKILPRGDSYASSVATYNGYIATAKANVGDSNTIIADVSNGLVTATNLQGDGVHPNSSGYAILANNELPLLAATGYTTSLSSASGSAGSPVTLSFTRATGTTWMTGDTVTVSDGGGGGSFGGLTFTSGVSTVATMTYTPATAGVKTLTPSNGQAWTNPSASSYTSIALSAGTLGLGLFLE